MDLRNVIERITGDIVKELSAVGGGDIGESHAATLGGGDRVFVKHYPASPPEAVRLEADGLRWLAEPAVVPVAAVRGFDEAARVLVLDWIEPGPETKQGDADFGRALAVLHQTDALVFGHVADNFIGSLPQSNHDHDTWAAFYGAERIAPQIQRAIATKHLDASDARLADALIDRLDDLFAPAEPPSRLHGDLWGGNRLCDREGRGWLIDPAAYAGHREMDLAMMRLFGGFSRAVFDAYAEQFPLAAGAADRVELCQLYPVLVHVNLFGGGYVDSARRILRHFAAGQ